MHSVKCSLCGQVLASKEDAVNHILTAHPEAVEKVIEKLPEKAREKLVKSCAGKDLKRWAAEYILRISGGL